MNAGKKESKRNKKRWTKIGKETNKKIPIQTKDFTTKTPLQFSEKL